MFCFIVLTCGQKFGRRVASQRMDRVFALRFAITVPDSYETNSLKKQQVKAFLCEREAPKYGKKSEKLRTLFTHRYPLVGSKDPSGFL